MPKPALIAVVACGLLWPSAAFAQADPARAFNPRQPDFTVINLPTSLRMPVHRGSFRVTHRFGRPLGLGDFGDLASDLFGLDGGAQIGLEFRFGIAPGVYAGMARTSDKTIQFTGHGSLVRQGDAVPFAADVIVAVNGTDNFSDEYSPAVGFVLARELGNAGAVYLEPMWVGNVNLDEALIAADDNALLLGLGARIRIRPTVYLVGEFIPRLTGYDAGTHLGTFGIEKRAGGHSFQLNFSNGLGTTLSQLARGGTAAEDWYIGFSISRKFF
jgi:hypothetical protein